MNGLRIKTFQTHLNAPRKGRSAGIDCVTTTLQFHAYVSGTPRLQLRHWMVTHRLPADWRPMRCTRRVTTQAKYQNSLVVAGGEKFVIAYFLVLLYTFFRPVLQRCHKNVNGF